MKNSNFRRLIYFFIIGIFISVSSENFAQNVGASNSSSINIANDLTLKLQQKILLTNDQADKVHDIIVDYYNNYTKNEQKKAETQIMSILDKKQKMKYDIVKNEWWNLLQKEISKMK